MLHELPVLAVFKAEGPDWLSPDHSVADQLLADIDAAGKSGTKPIIVESNTEADEGRPFWSCRYDVLSLGADTNLALKGMKSAAPEFVDITPVGEHNPGQGKSSSQGDR
jgi:hypothetical protein